MNQNAHQEEMPPLPTTPGDLFVYLKTLGISYELYHHPPFFTVEEGLEFEKDIPGVHCRNLFLRDKKKNMGLLTLANETAVDLKNLAPLLDMGRLSFGSADRLWQYLGIRPGSVCPFTIMNDTEKQVRVFLDQAMMDAELVNYHPLDNSMTIGITPADLLKFIDSCGHKPHIVDLGAAAP